MDFCSYLAMHRRERQLLQRELAQALDLHPSYIAQLEKGRRGPPSEEVVERLAEGLQMSKEETAIFRALADSRRIQDFIGGFKGKLPGAEELLKLAAALPSLEASEMDMLRSVARYLGGKAVIASDATSNPVCDQGKGNAPAQDC